MDANSSELLVDHFEKQVDLLLLLDIIDHLVNQEKVIRSLRGVLSETGLVIASIPNVRSLKILFPLLLRWRFDYAESGILDQTHLRFLTKRSAVLLFSKNDYEVLKLKGQPVFPRQKHLWIYRCIYELHHFPLI